MGIVRSGVPIFIMISGMFLLDYRRYSDSVSKNFKKILTKNIVRIIIALIFWSLIYDFFIFKKNSDLIILKFLFNGARFHLWFLYLIIGLYILTPFLHVLIKNLSKKDFELLLIVLAVYCCAYELVNVFLKFFLNKTLFKNYVNEFGGYLIYFLAGYYFANFEISKKSKITFYILAIISLLFAFFANSLFALETKKHMEMFGNPKLLNVMFLAFGVFIFTKDLFINFQNKGKFAKIITKLSSLSFGIYLIHIFVREMARKIITIGDIAINPPIMVLLLAIAVFAISALLAFILSKIPILRKVV